MAEKLTLTDDLISSRLHIQRRLDEPRVGYNERIQTWDRSRSTIAQLLISYPSVLNFIKARNSGVVLQELSNIHGLLCKLVSLIADITEQIPQEAEGSFIDLQRLVQSSIDSKRVPIQTLKKTAALAVANTVKNSVRRKRVVQEVSLERLSSIQRDIENRIVTLKNTLSIAAFDGQPLSGLKSVAVAPLYEKLYQSTTAPPSVDEAVNIMMSVGSIEAMERTSSVRFKVHKELQIPVSFSTSCSGTLVTFDISPSLLGIQAGDQITVGPKTVEIVTVSSDSIEVSEAVSDSNIVLVRDSSYSQFRVFSNAVQFVFSLNTEEITKPLSTHNRSSASSAAYRIAKQAAMIAPISTEASHGLSILGAETPTGENKLDLLRSIQIEEPPEVSTIISRIRELLRDEGFNVADQKIMHGDITALIEEDPRGASSKIANIDESLGLVAQYLGDIL